MSSLALCSIWLNQEMQSRIGLLVVAMIAMLTRPAAGQSDRASDSERKGLFVYNLMLFVRWPADAFQNPAEALRVHVIGRDPFDGSFDRLLADKSVDRRRIVVTHSAAPITAPWPHVLRGGSTHVTAARHPQACRTTRRIPSDFNAAAYCLCHAIRKRESSAPA